MTNDPSEDLTPEELLARGRAMIESGDTERLIDWALDTVNAANARGRPDVAERAKEVLKNLVDTRAANLETNEQLRRLLEDDD